MNLHGRGATLTEVSFIAGHDSDKALPAEQDFIQLEVFGRTNNAYRWAGEVDVFEAIDAVTKQYTIDPNRILLRGFSMGGAGTWHIGLHYPGHWAAIEAGADEASFGQVLGWEVKGFTGENEIDLIARKGERLCFVSCKAFRSELDMHDRKHRHRLMDAVHEADNLADHFGREGEKVAMLVTTDLFDEIKDSPRYVALMGKAAVLDVKIIALEDLGWHKLVQAMRDLLAVEALT